MLSAQEASLQHAAHSVRSQENVSTEIFHIADKPKHEANVALYGTFSRRSIQFELLSRVDADMVIVEKRLFYAAARVFERHPDVDHLIIGVDDFFSGRKIDGLHLWRGGVTWNDSPPDLFSDLGHTTVRRKVKWAPTDRSLVLHAHEPSRLECARYGAHRGLKFRASGNSTRGRDLEDFVRYAGQSPDPRRLLAVAAVEASLSDPVFGRRFVDGIHLIDEQDWTQLLSRCEVADDLVAKTLSAIRRVPLKPRTKATKPRHAPARRLANSLRGLTKRPESDAVVVDTLVNALDE